MSKNNKGIAAQMHLNTKPTKPEVKTQAAGKPMPILKYISKMNSLYGNTEKEPAKKAPRMSAKKSWQVIKQSMDKDKPAKLEPVILDPYLTSMLGDDF